MLIPICILIAIIIVVLLCITNTPDLLKENYTPIIYRQLPILKNQNTCPYPFTNSKPHSRYKQANDKVYVSNYGNRKILNPNNYLELIEQLLDDLSNKNINVFNLPTNLLINKEYLGDDSTITNFINNNINKLVNTEKYLQNNGPWKYEYFNVSEPKIYYYEINNSSRYFEDLPEKFNLFKIIYTLGNVLRSSYTECLAFITVIDNKFEIQYTTFVTKFEKDYARNNLNVISEESLEFSFIDAIANNNFDKFGNSNNFSGINYIKEQQNEKIEIKSDIPAEFKEILCKKQHLPPLFGNGIVPYLPETNI